jgi:PAS domain S-box-containing protein
MKNSIFYFHPMPMWILDCKTHRFLDVNEAAVQSYGYSKEEFLAMTADELRPAFEIQRFLETWKEKKKAVWDYGIWIHKRKNGALAYVNIRTAPLNDGEESPEVVFAEQISHTNTKEDQIEQLTQESLNIKNAVTIASIVSITNSDGIINYVNRNFEVVSGYSRDELLGKKHNIINSGFHSRSFWKEMWSTIASGNTWRGDVKNKARNGTFYWVDTFIVPMRCVNGKINSYISIRNLITLKKEQDDLIYKMKKRLEAFLDSSNNISILLSPEFEILAYNKSAFKFVKNLYDREMKEGESFRNYCTSELLKIINHHFPSILDGERIDQLEFAWKCNEKAVEWKLQLLPAYNDTDKVFAVAFNAEDITVLKESQRKILKQNQILKSIAWKQSHVMRSPLANALGLLQVPEMFKDQKMFEIVNDELHKVDKVIREMVIEASENGNGF